MEIARQAEDRMPAVILEPAPAPPPAVSALAEHPAATAAIPEWSPARRLLFRFAFSYLVLYILPFPLTADPTGVLAAPFDRLWNAIVPWVGRVVFGLDVAVEFNGSGDKTANYLRVLCVAVLAVAATLVWTLLDRRRRDYARLHVWLRLYVRLFLATVLLGYGAFKVINSQFPAPRLDRLVQPFGDSSPMGLLWTFMGASEGYTIFGGALEMLAGLLLVARRTTTLGALLATAVLANIVMLNFSYDVPVKLSALHLLAMALFLLGPDLRRLADLLVFNRPVPARELVPLFGRRGLHRGALVLRAAFILMVAGLALDGARQARAAYGNGAPRPPLYGIWEVRELAVDGQVRPPLMTDAERWRRVIFGDARFMAIQLMSDKRQRYLVEVDAKKRTLAMTKRDDPDWKATLAYRRAGPRLLRLAGTFEGHQVRALLHRVDETEFLLVSRGFHWINEAPFNR
jgi:uncharacterized membrane protein YphA (DoxX/SURF4 family)